MNAGTHRRDTKAISRTAILAKGAARDSEVIPTGTFTIVAFVIATALLCFLGATMLLAA